MMLRILPVCAALLLIPGASGQTGLQENFTQCTQITNDSKRLACFDQLAVPLATQPAPVAKSAAPIRPVAPVRQQQQPQRVVTVKPQSGIAPVGIDRTTEQPAPTARPVAEATAVAVAEQHKAASFGLKKRLVDKNHAIALTIKSMRRNTRGKLIMTFTNGQVWQQNDSRKWLDFSGDITIEKGIFGTFKLRQPKRNGLMKVMRLQ